MRAGRSTLYIKVSVPKRFLFIRAEEEGIRAHHVIAVTFLIPSSAWRWFSVLELHLPGLRRGPQPLCSPSRDLEKTTVASPESVRLDKPLCHRRVNTAGCASPLARGRARYREPRAEMSYSDRSNGSPRPRADDGGSSGAGRPAPQGTERGPR